MRPFHVLGAALAVSMISARVSAAPCGSLTSVRVEHTTITAATIVRAGAFAPRLAAYADPIPPNAFASLPEFCRVEGSIARTADSHADFEVWMPVSGWNGRYMGVGNGGSGGFVSYFAANGVSLAEALRDGFAVSSTDTGHQGANDDFSFARGHREQRIDYHYRAIHDTALAAKAVVRAFYGSDPKHSYFSGCSDGGRQGLMEAQRYPADYDGVLVCGPAVHRTDSIKAWISVAQAVESAPGAGIPPNKLTAIHDAVVASCDALDGVRDGLVSEPTKCRFDPGSLLCKGADSERCLTKPQAATLARFYAWFLPGAELDPAGVIACRDCKASASHRAAIFLDGLFDGRFNLETFDFDRDVQVLERSEDARLTNTTDPNLTAFKARGGKLMIVHGWSDGADPALNSVRYYESVVRTMGSGAVDRFFRLYMLPGVYHNASRGPGPTAFPGPMLKALEDWVENTIAPNAVITATRPLCPYPAIAMYRGAGSTNEAENFACKAPTK